MPSNHANDTPNAVAILGSSRELVVFPNMMRLIEPCVAPTARASPDWLTR